MQGATPGSGRLLCAGELTEKLRLGTCGQPVHLSPFQFSRNFKKEMGLHSGLVVRASAEAAGL